MSVWGGGGGGWPPSHLNRYMYVFTCYTCQIKVPGVHGSLVLSSQILQVG